MCIGVALLMAAVLVPGPVNMNGNSKFDRHHRLPRVLYENSTVMSSDLDTTSFLDTEDDTVSR